MRRFGDHVVVGRNRPGRGDNLGAAHDSESLESHPAWANGCRAPARRPGAEAAAIAAYNRRLAGDARLNTAWLPLRDGVGLSVRV